MSKSNFDKDEDQEALLKDCGREMAEHWMRSAIEQSENSDQMTNQIAVLRAASISVLAHEAYNRSEQMGTSLNESLSSLVIDIQRECTLISKNL